MTVITLATQCSEEFVDITAQVQRLVAASAVREGLCHLWCRHTTAALTVNENADPDVRHDLLLGLARIVSADWPFRHAEGNSAAHLKSSLLGCQLTLPVRDGRLALGTWQGVYFAEFDGPRPRREVEVTVLASYGVGELPAE